MYLIYAMLIREKKYYDLVESLKSIGEESRIQEYKYWSIIKRAKQTLLFFEPNPQSLTDQITLNTQQQQKYNDLKNSGIDVLYDDRVDAQAGFKFNDADLLGMPVQIIVGDKKLKENKVELKLRETGERFDIDLSDLLVKVKELLN